MPNKSVRPRSATANDNLPPAKRIKLSVSGAVNRLSRNFVRVINIPTNKYNLGTITSISNVALGVRLSRKLVSDFKKIYSESYKKQIEYVGSTRFMVKNTRGYVKFNTPTASTNDSFTKVTPKMNELDSYIMYHTHPVPPGSGDNIFTLPSLTDFEVYIGVYPYVQANIILEKNGYYVIDLNETDQLIKPNITEFKQFWMNEIFKGGKFNKFVNTYRNIYFFQTSPASWKKTINTYVNDTLLQRFGISVKYYTYSELAPITLLDKTQIMLP
jgi:hypothetical protein